MRKNCENQKKTGRGDFYPFGALLTYDFEPYMHTAKIAEGGVLFGSEGEGQKFSRLPRKIFEIPPKMAKNQKKFRQNWPKKRRLSVIFTLNRNFFSIFRGVGKSSGGKGSLPMTLSIVW